jgi:hypothetical protein
MGLNDSKSRAALPTNTIFMNISHNIEGGMGYYKGKGNARTYHQVQNFSGMVVNLKREWDNGSQADKIKPHFNYIFTFQDGEEAYQLSLPENVTYTTELLNQFLCATASKPIEVHVALWDRAGKKVRISLIQNGALIERQFTEWDSELQTLTGIPPVKDANGEYDYKARNAFWFDKYKTILYPKFNGGEEWKETSDQKKEAEPTAPPVNIYEGTTAETPKAAVATVYSTLQTKFKGMPPSEFIEKWAAINGYATQQVAKKTLSILEWDNLVVLANQLYEEFRAMNFPNNPQTFFMTNGTIRTARITPPPPDYTDDLPF